MDKRLQDMSLEELWALFPIVLVSHNPKWKEWAEDEMAYLEISLSDYHPIVNHVGSTAIPGIMAKPIVDIIVEISPNCDWQRIREIMESNGYICMSKSDGRMSFNKGYTPEGYAEKVFHIHFHRIGDNDEIIFRDILNAHPDLAKEYEVLKLGLLPKYRHDRDGYTEAKTDFIKRVLLRPKEMSVAIGEAGRHCFRKNGAKSSNG